MGNWPRDCIKDHAAFKPNSMAPPRNAAAELGLDSKAGFAVVGFAGSHALLGESAGTGVLGERVLHLLSLRMSSIDPTACVLLSGAIYYALVPVPGDGARSRLAERVKPSLRQLERMGIEMRAAIGPWVPDLTAIPAARQIVDDLLEVLERGGRHAAARVATAEDLWSDLALLPPIVQRLWVDGSGPKRSPCWGGHQLQVVQDHSRIHYRRRRGRIDVVNAVEMSGEVQDHTGPDRVAGERRSGAPGDQRHSQRAAHLDHDGDLVDHDGDLVDHVWEHRNGRYYAVERGVGGVECGACWS